MLLLNHYNRLSPRVELEIKALRERGYRVHVLFWARLDDPVPSNAKFYDCSVVRFPAPRGSLKLLLYLPAFYRTAMQHLHALEERFDVVHCTHIMLLPLAIWLKRRWRAVAVYDVHEFHLHEMAERLPRWLRWMVLGLRKLEDWLVRRTDGVLTVDSAGRELERRYSALQPNTAVLYNVPEARLELDKGKLQALQARYANREVVVYVGGLSEAKGALIAPKVVQHVAQRRPQALFLFIGMFHTEFVKKRFQELIAHLNLEPHVEVVPWLPYHDMLHYVALARVGLALHQPVSRFFRVSKGNGRKFFTYMQLGIPIVGPSLGEVGRVVQEERCGVLVDTTDPQAVAEAILYLLEHPDEAYKMGERGRKAIQERYNWELERQKLLAVYRRALQRRASEVRPSHEPSNGSSKESGS